ncbi:MAG: hypothetical protein V4710_13695 [Verrucomicrobiota bacterium]
MRGDYLLIATVALSLAACERKGSTVIVETRPPHSSPAEAIPPITTRETKKLGEAIDSFQAHPTAEASAEVKKRFAELDGEIAELELSAAKSSGREQEEANAKVRNLQSYRMTEAARFTRIQGPSTDRLPSETPPDSRTATDKVEDKARDVGDRLEAGAKKAGEVIKDAAERTGEAVKDVVR